MSENHLFPFLPPRFELIHGVFGPKEQPEQCQASDADCVNTFMRDLADPQIRVLTQTNHAGRNYGTDGKAAILAALTENVQLRADRDSWKKGCENWLNSATALDKTAREYQRELAVTKQPLHKCCGDLENLHQGAFEQANELIARCDLYYWITVGSVAANIVLLIALFAYYFGL